MPNDATEAPLTDRELKREIVLRALVQSVDITAEWPGVGRVKVRLTAGEAIDLFARPSQEVTNG